MSKAKKESGSKSASAGHSPKQPAKKAAAKKPTPATDTPFVDTNLAAESAARLLAARVSTKAGSADTQPRTESAMFKQLKSGLSNPAGQTMANLLDKQGGPNQKKSATPFGPGQQVGRNQTFGADVNRASVPRRTGGG
jgi:hypothetical protein